MSVHVMSHVWKYGPRSGGELLVLLAIADFADDDGYCWPSVRRIAEKARMTERGVQKIVRRLCDEGRLSVEMGGGRGGSNRYCVSLQNPERETPNDVHPERETPNMETETPNVGAKTPNGGSPKPSRTIKETSEDIRAILCQVLSKEVADDFIAHRKAKRANLTKRAAKLIAAELAKCRDPEAAVLKSIKNGWTGVFPDKEKSNDRPFKQSDFAASFIAGATGRS